MSDTTDIISPRHPWLDRLNTEPDRAVDALLRSVAHLSGLQRASPSEALMALLGDLPLEAPEWELVDRALLVWLQSRRKTADGLLGRPGGVERFIRETSEAFRAAWRLELPESCTWMRAEMFDLLRWADGFSLDATFDLARAVLTSAAYVQRSNEFRFLWLRICEEAAVPRLRHRLDAALLGLAKVPCERAGGPSHDLIVGLARWAARLPNNDSSKSEVVREWRALKAAFPRQPSFWREQWEAILDDERISAHPFTNWLRESDQALQVQRNAGQSRRRPQLPQDIKGIIAQMGQDYLTQGLTQPLWQRMKALLDQVEHYADFTGESYYLVTSCTNIASIILEQAPSHALTLVRRALLWSPSNGHAWSVRANALVQLGRRDLAEVVLWEAMRRIPSNAALHLDLALALAERAEFAEAEALLRKATTFQPTDSAIATELARIVWLQGRVDESLTLLREFPGRGKGERHGLYTLGCLLIAEGQETEAFKVLEQYRRSFGNSQHTSTLKRLIDSGASGQKEMQDHLHERRKYGVAVQSNTWDAESTERVLSAEWTEFPRLERISQVAKADFLFSLGEKRRTDALRLVDAALTDPAFAYAQVVKGLAVPEYSIEMIGRTGCFAGSLPVSLALTPQNVTPDHWKDLVRRFPEASHLTYLVQLARGQADDSVREALWAWCDEPMPSDDDWGKYLKEALRQHLEGIENPVDLNTLVHNALTQAVDVGMDTMPQAA